MNSNKPFIIPFSKIGSSELGYISVVEGTQLPFPVKRVYWTYFTPEDIRRGRHAHYELEQILIAIGGKIIVTTEMQNGEKSEFILDKPNMGLFLPKMCWHEMQYSHNAVQVCIASGEYEESDYIRIYEEFKVK